jgi:hypothetical protein
MNKDTKEIVYQTLAVNEKTREDDWLLIETVVCKMLPVHQYTPFTCVLDQMRKNGISFESITRHRRKFFEINPSLNPDNIDRLRRNEEIIYHEEYSKHITNLY